MGSDWNAPRERPDDCAFEGHCEPRRAPAKKDKKKWCRGKVGISHVPIVGRRPSYGWSCRIGHAGYLLCYHRTECANCGKVLDPFFDRTKCPDLSVPRNEGPDGNPTSP